MAAATRTICDFSDTGVEVSDPWGVRERLRGTFTDVADERDGGCLTSKVLTLPPSRDLPEPRYLRHRKGCIRTPGALGGAPRVWTRKGEVSENCPRLQPGLPPLLSARVGPEDSASGGDVLSGLTRISIRNYRALADVQLELRPINVVFGPNGAGKSTLLDSVYFFFRDCAIRGVEVASSERDHGIGILSDGALDDERISVELSNDDVSYALSFSISAGRLDPFPGERLVSASRTLTLIDRKPGSDEAALYHAQVEQGPRISLREPEKPSLNLFLNFNDRDEEAAALDRLLHFVRLYNSRSFHIRPLKRRGSESSHQTRLWDFGNNAWSVLRNLQDKRNVDERYDTIMGHMAEAFPMFDGIVLEQTGPTSVYASFQEKGRRDGIYASGVSDGYVQLLLLLIALFSEGKRESVLLFDEPEVSLHPWALAVFARAVKMAARQWNKQVFLATHSPVLISQFDPPDILVASMDEGRARFERLSEIHEFRDLLEEYAAGSLYMSGAVAPQGAEALAESDG